MPSTPFGFAHARTRMQPRSGMVGTVRAVPGAVQTSSNEAMWRAVWACLSATMEEWRVTKSIWMEVCNGWRA